MSGPQPLVSVVIPAYNYGRYIGRALDSVLRQTYPRWECVVVDDGSADDTPEVVAGYAGKEGRIRYLRQPNRGPSSARNAGIRESRGRYLQFLDADDLIEERKLELQVNFLESRPEVGLVYGGMLYFASEDESARRYSFSDPDRPWMPEISGTGREILEVLIRHNIMVINAPLIRRGVLEAAGGFDEALTSNEDWDYWIRCADRGVRFEFLGGEGTLALVRLHTGSLSRDRVSMLEGLLKLRRKVGRGVSDAEAVNLNRILFAGETGLLGVEFVRRGGLAPGVWYLFKAGVLSRGPHARMKWLCLAAAAPFTPEVVCRHQD